MLRFDHDKARDVAVNTRAALADYDNAIRSLASLTVSVIDAASGSELAASERQRLMEKMHASAGEALSGRAGMVEMVAMLTGLQRRSDQAETGFGCPGPVPLAPADRVPDGMSDRQGGLRAVA